MSAVPIMSRPHTLIAADERQSRRITVASLCCNTDGATKDYHPGGHNAFSSSDVPTTTTYQQLVHPAIAVALPSLMSVHCQHRSGPKVANTLCCVSHLDTTNISGAPNHFPDPTSGGLFHDDGATGDPSMINTRAEKGSFEGDCNNSSSRRAPELVHTVANAKKELSLVKRRAITLSK